MTDQTSQSVEPAPTMMGVPKFSVSLFNLNVSPTEFNILGSSSMPGVSSSGEVVMGQRPECVVAMSPHAAKELMMLLQEMVAKYEEMAGPLKTPFIEERSTR